MERDWDLQHSYGTMGSNWHGQATRRLGIDRKAEEAARRTAEKEALLATVDGAKAAG